MSSVQKFLATSNGLCATRWLSYVLASRPDVFVAHGKYPMDSIMSGRAGSETEKDNVSSLSYGNVNEFFYGMHDLERVFLEYGKLKPDAVALGNVHTYTLRLAEKLIQHDPEAYAVVNIVRHPVTYVNSHVSMVNKSKSNPYLFDKYRKGLFMNALDRYPMLVSPSLADPSDVFSFVISCLSLKQMAEDLLLDGVHMKMEELTSSVDTLDKFCTRLTGLAYDRQVLRGMLAAGPVNRHRNPGQSNDPVPICHTWQDWQHGLFRDIIPEHLLEGYGRLGYDISMLETPKARTCPKGSDMGTAPVGPRIIKDNTRTDTPKVSLILLDWSCRERFHALDWLDRQTVPRDLYEIIWVELYDRAIPEVMEKADCVIACSQESLYHKHKGYNQGLLNARGDIVTVCDSDAVFANFFIETILDHFYDDNGECRSRVLFHHEQRAPAGTFYRDGLENLYPKGLADTSEMFKYAQWLDIWPNVGACMSVKKSDAFFFGGFDESETYRGLVCGPYDLGWRMVNAGIPEIWEGKIALFHFAHPNSDQNMDSESRRQISYPQIEGHALTAVDAFSTGRIQPLLENPDIYRKRLDMRVVGTAFERKYAETGRFASPLNYPPFDFGTEGSSERIMENIMDTFNQAIHGVLNAGAGLPTVHKNRRTGETRVSIVLLDWSCRERFHALDWLEKQTIPRERYQVIWVELYDKVSPQAMDKADVVICCHQKGLYHKHQGYNAGVLNAEGVIVTVCDSDAVFPENFVESIVSSFNADHGKERPVSKVLMHYQYRSKQPYPEDLDSLDQLAEYQWMHLWPNVGACVSFLREDIVRFGGFDEDACFRGYICGPYELAWRMVNAGIPEAWHSEKTSLWHFAHPHSNQSENTESWKEIGTEHIDWHAAGAVQAFSSGRILPLKENGTIWNLRMDRRVIGSTFEERYADFSTMASFLTNSLNDFIPAMAWDEVLSILSRILRHVDASSSDLGLLIWNTVPKLGEAMSGSDGFAGIGQAFMCHADGLKHAAFSSLDHADLPMVIRNSRDPMKTLHFLLALGLLKDDPVRLYDMIVHLLGKIDKTEPTLKHLSEQLVFIGRKLKETGREDFVERCFVKANELDAKNPQAYLELAALNIERGDAENALAYSERGVQVNPSNPDMVMVRIRALEMKGRYLEAIRYIEFYWSLYRDNKVSKLKENHARLPEEHGRFMRLHGHQVARGFH